MSEKFKEQKKKKKKKKKKHIGAPKMVICVGEKNYYNVAPKFPLAC